MKIVSYFPSRASIAALAFLAAWFAGPGGGHAQSQGAQLPPGLTCQKVPLEGHVTSNPIACAVSCAKGGKLASALPWPAHDSGADDHDQRDLRRSRRSSPRECHVTGRLVGRRPAGARRVEQPGSRHQRRRRNPR